MKKDVSLPLGAAFTHYLKAFAAAFFVTVILFALVSALFTFADIPQKVWEWFLGSCSAFSAFIAALFSSIGTRKMGYLTGILSSLCYTVLLFFIGAVIFPGEIALNIFFKRLIKAAVFGTFGGILGINLSPKKTVL